jgi:hypothetical protein
LEKRKADVKNMGVPGTSWEEKPKTEPEMPGDPLSAAYVAGRVVGGGN